MSSVRCSLALFLAAAAVAAFTFRDYGVTWDEPFHVRYGERVLRYFSSGFAETEAVHKSNLVYYGALFDLTGALAERVSPFGVYETRHLLSALTGLAGVLGCYLLARSLGGNRAAFLAALLLLVTPRWWGHSFFNPKDIPFAAGYVWSLYCITCAIPALPRIPPKLALLTGLAIGSTLALRVGGVLLFVYLGLAMAVQLAYEVSRRGFGSALATVGIQLKSLAVVVFPAWGLMLLFWPWAQSRPIRAPIEALSLMSQFVWRGTVLFEGRDFHVTQIPRRYMVEWLAITLPEIVLLGLALGLAIVLYRAVKGEIRPHSEKALKLALVIFAASFPLVYIAVRKPIVYDGMRHVLFVLPLLAVIAALAFDFALERLRTRSAGAVLGLGGIYLLYHLSILIRLHPHEYVYFNRLVGGLPGADGRYETDYWGESYREAVAILVDRLQSESKAPPPPYQVFLCSNPVSATYFFPPYLSSTRDPDQADFLMATTRFRCHESLEGEVLGVVERFGTPLAYVKDRRRLVPARRRH
ncbi:MAG TPA: hypothetical protein VIE88_12550 [Vicinamibacteria bacterium]